MRAPVPRQMLPTEWRPPTAMPKRQAVGAARERAVRPRSSDETGRMARLRALGGAFVEQLDQNWIPTSPFLSNSNPCYRELHEPSLEEWVG